jgi:rhamnosyltransferase
MDTSERGFSKIMTFCLVVPTLNAGAKWTEWIEALRAQRTQPLRTLVIDSGSSDGTPTIAEQAGLDVHRIPLQSFNHGGTRQLGIEMIRNDCEFVVFLTQDAILADENALENLIASFDNPKVGAAYGRQLPHHEACPMGAHARLFNYGAHPMLKGKADIEHLGIKCCFISNSFSAYRLSALDIVGGFPSDVILGEDTYVAGRMILNDWLIQYTACAQVRHSHDYSALAELRRYFDTGVFHARNPWLLKTFGKAGGEGLRFVRSELAYLWHYAPKSLTGALFRTVAKLAGYKLGQLEAALPIRLKRWFSMNKGFWNEIN